MTDYFRWHNATRVRQYGYIFNPELGDAGIAWVMPWVSYDHVRRLANGRPMVRRIIEIHETESI